jgi:hypothetical protein
MIFHGNFIVMDGEPTVVVFFFHPNQLVVTVDFGVGLNDVPRFNRLTFVFHLDKSIADFLEKVNLFRNFFSKVDNRTTSSRSEYTRRCGLENKAVDVYYQ